MSRNLLKLFVDEEVDAHVRQLLLPFLVDCLGTAAKWRQRTFEFNRFNVVIDCKTRTVTIDDELNVAGEGCWSLEEFAEAIQSADPAG